MTSIANAKEQAHSPFRQRSQDIPVGTLRRKARNIPPARMSILLRSTISRDGELDQFVAGAGSLHFGGCCEMADDADLGEGSSRCRGAERAKRGRHGDAADSEHLVAGLRRTREASITCNGTGELDALMN
jgi:hypothetical protein